MLAAKITHRVTTTTPLAAGTALLRLRRSFTEQALDRTQLHREMQGLAGTAAGAEAFPPPSPPPSSQTAAEPFKPLQDRYSDTTELKSLHTVLSSLTAQQKATTAILASILPRLTTLESRHEGGREVDYQQLYPAIATALREIAALKAGSGEVLNALERCIARLEERPVEKEGEARVGRGWVKVWPPLLALLVLLTLPGAVAMVGEILLARKQAEVATREKEEVERKRKAGGWWGQLWY